MAHISIFGIGYVGVTLSLALGSKGVKSISIDANPEKVDMIEKGISPVKEEGLDELAKELRGKGIIRATTSIDEAISNSEISFICVGTPSNEVGEVNLDYVWKCLEQIGLALQKKKKYHLIIIRSTVPPGTHVKALELLSKYIPADMFGLCSNPEFMREGSSLEDFFKAEFNIVGSDNPKSSQKLKEFYESSGFSNVYVVDAVSAEMFKYLNNWFHALKISFANEVRRLADFYGADAQEIMAIFVKDHRLNVSPAYLKPGFAFGGSCLPKDLRAVSSFARMNNLKLPVAENILESNDAHLNFIAQKIKKLGHKKIGFAGLVFKPGTDDFRESPYLRLLSEFIGIEKYAYDKNLSSSVLIGKNREFIEGFFAAVNIKQTPSIEKLVQISDVIVIGSLTKQEVAELQVLSKKYNKPLFDLQSNEVLIDRT